MQGTDKTCEQLADEIIANLDESYDLVYVDYRDELSDEQAAALVRGDFESLYESLNDFELDSRYESARYIIEEQTREILRDWEDETGADLTYLNDEFLHSDAWERVREVIEERDTGNWLGQIIRQTGRVLLRVSALDEDHAYSFKQVDLERVLADLGLPATAENVETMTRTLRECSPEFSVLMGFWVAGVNLDDIYSLPTDPDADVDLVNPYLYLGNPFSGSGFISEHPFSGKVRVKRRELATDSDAFGYSVDRIYGGLRASDFEVEIRATAQEN